MEKKFLAEPDMDFISQIMKQEGGSFKKCYQCATCSVVCSLSPDNRPFPRRQMLAVSWGLKEQVLADPAIWLCHQCGDCSARCPRGAKPGDVLAALRAYAIAEYARPGFWAKAVNDPRKLPWLLALPVAIFLILGSLTGLLDLTPPGNRVVHAKFFSTWLVDMIFVPLAIAMVTAFGLSIRGFLDNMHQNAMREKGAEKTKLDLMRFFRALIRVLPTVLRHDNFSECSENRTRDTAHLMVFFGFAGLFITTASIFIMLYIFGIHGPFSQLTPLKWLANIAGMCLIVGAVQMLTTRLRKKDQKTVYADWYLIGLVLGLGITGMLTEVTRLASMAGLSYGLYVAHLVCAFHLIAFLPYSKLAHMVYRTVAMAYAEYDSSEKRRSSELEPVRQK